MKTTTKLALAGLFSTITALAAMPSFADCNPPCKGNRVCRYDSTHNPQFFCRKPVAAQSATTTAPAKSIGGPAQPAGSITELGFPKAKSTASPANAGPRGASKCYREGGVNDTTHKRARATGC